MAAAGARGHELRCSVVAGGEGWITCRVERVVAVGAAGPGEGTVGAPAWGAGDGASVGAEGRAAMGRAGCCA